MIRLRRRSLIEEGRDCGDAAVASCPRSHGDPVRSGHILEARAGVGERALSCNRPRAATHEAGRGVPVPPQIVAPCRTAERPTASGQLPA